MRQAQGISRKSSLSPFLLLLLWGAAARAEPDGGQAAPQTVVLAPALADAPPPERVPAHVGARALEEQQPRSLPDALRLSPGVTVQQTAAGQASPILRGLTGQQTVIAFDGIKLNNSTWRKGPNQYGFTLDARAIESIDVVRSGAGTFYGNGALGGAVLVHPRLPSPTPGLRPSLLLRGATADLEWGGRLGLEGAAGPLRFLAGVGGRRVGLLQSSGPVRSITTGAPAAVPSFAADGRSQLGTGFDEVTFDGRAMLDGRHGTLTLAGNGYLQFDAPRTDQCPPRGGQPGDCQLYERQQRGLVYAALDTGPLLGGRVERSRLTVSWQRQYERRKTTRGATRERGEDTVDTLAATARAAGISFISGELETGVELSLDFLRSSATVEDLDQGTFETRSRGQYLDGSRAASVGFWGQQRWRAGILGVHAGGRVGAETLFAPAEPLSSSAGVDRGFGAYALNAGLVVGEKRPLSAGLTLDRSYRTPNLDDLTSRQATGAGFQLENASLGPEQATSLELGLHLRLPRLRASAWAFGALLEGAVNRVSVPASACPAELPACGAASARYSFVNAEQPAWLAGAELELWARPFDALTARTVLSWAWGEGPNAPGASPARVPLSRVPPLNGAVELTGDLPRGFWVGAALRWSAQQRRLAPSDATDARIPEGGTPAWAVVDLRAGYRFGEWLSVAAVLENLFDTAYRVHGSSLNGPGRGLLLTVGFSPDVGAGHAPH